MGWLMGLTPWLQVPVILAVAVPACAVAGAVVLWLVDWVFRAAGRISASLRGMANPEELRKQDQKLPRQQRKYPQSRVTQVMWVLIALVVVAAIVSAVTG